MSSSVSVYRHKTNFYYLQSVISRKKHLRFQKLTVPLGDLFGFPAIVQCSVMFMYIQAPESGFLRPIIVGSKPSNDKAAILVGQKELLSGA